MVTTTAPPTAAETLAAYRSNHRIALEQTGDEYRCALDGIRVLPVKSRLGDQRWRHDPGRVVALLEATYGGPWGGPKATAIERIVETVGTDQDDEFDREGQPEFNGSFR